MNWIEIEGLTKTVELIMFGNNAFKLSWSFPTGEYKTFLDYNSEFVCVLFTVFIL